MTSLNDVIDIHADDTYDDSNLDDLLHIEDEIKQQYESSSNTSTPHKKQKVTHPTSSSSSHSKISSNHNSNSNGNKTASSSSTTTSTPSSQESSSSSTNKILSLDDEAAQQAFANELIEEDQQLLASMKKSNNHHNNDNPSLECCECSSLKYNIPYYHAFHIAVCNNCQLQNTEKYTLISRTKAKEQYLLTDTDLDALLYLSKPNPHRSTYASMKLYRKIEIENIAFQRYGTADNIQLERQKRDTVKVRREEKLRVKHQKQLQQQAKAEEYASNYVPKSSNESIHQHVYTTRNNGTQKCKICGFTVDYEEL
jgi:DNA-repair protein complementing XP-A cells